MTFRPGNGIIYMKKMSDKFSSFHNGRIFIVKDKNNGPFTGREKRPRPKLAHNNMSDKIETNARTEAEEIGRTLFIEEFGQHLNHIKFTSNLYDTTDLYCVMLDSQQISHNIVADIKAYRDTEHPRPYAKVTATGYQYDNYMIDLKKIMDIILKSREKVNGEAMLFVFFSDRTLVWNFTDEYWRKIAQRSEPRLVNFDGRNYGAKKTWEFMTYLKREEAIYENVYQS